MVSPMKETTISISDFKQVALMEADFSKFNNLEKQVMDELVEQIRNEIDADIMATLDTIDLRSLHALMLKQAKRLRGFVSEQRFAHHLSWERQLGASTSGWKARLKRFHPNAPWSYLTDWEDKDGHFYFQDEEDQVQFLLLMR
jgi:hypothetical protein